MLSYLILYYLILYYLILYYLILSYIILYYIILSIYLSIHLSLPPCIYMYNPRYIYIYSQKIYDSTISFFHLRDQGDRQATTKALSQNEEAKSQETEEKHLLLRRFFLGFSVFGSSFWVSILVRSKTVRQFKKTTTNITFLAIRCKVTIPFLEGAVQICEEKIGETPRVKHQSCAQPKLTFSQAEFVLNS